MGETSLDVVLNNRGMLAHIFLVFLNPKDTICVAGGVATGLKRS